MMQGSCFYAHYQAFARLIAMRGICVFMVDFRNSLIPGLVGSEGSSGEVAKYPGGLNDCVSGIKFLHSNASSFGVASDKIFLSGESGGGNLCLATAMRLNQAGKMHLVSAWHRLGSCCRCGFIHSTCNSGARDLRFVPLRRRELPQREIPQHGDQQRDFAAARRPWPTFVRGLLMLATQFCVSCN